MISAIKTVLLKIISLDVTNSKLLYLQKIFMMKNILIVSGVSIIHEKENIEVKITQDSRQKVFTCNV